NPVVVREGRVFVLPTDAKHIMVYDAASGAEVKRIEVAAIRQQMTMTPIGSESATPQALLAVDGNQMVLTGGKVVFCIDWTKPAQDDMVWYKDFATDVVGRGFVTSDTVFVCTIAGGDKKVIGYGSLYRIDRATGKVQGAYPVRKDWDENE